MVFEIGGRNEARINFSDVAYRSLLCNPAIRATRSGGPTGLLQNIVGRRCCVRFHRGTTRASSRFPRSSAATDQSFHRQDKPAADIRVDGRSWPIPSHRPLGGRLLRANRADKCRVSRLGAGHRTAIGTIWRADGKQRSRGARLWPWKRCPLAGKSMGHGIGRRRGDCNSPGDRLGKLSQRPTMWSSSETLQPIRLGIGNSMVNFVPCPTTLSTSMRPRCASMIRCVIGSPNPDPPFLVE